MTTYTTINEAIQREIIEPIEAGDVGPGEAGTHFDLEAIAGELLTWDDAYSAEHDVYHLSNQGFRVKPEYTSADEDGPANAWALIERHQRRVPHAA